MQNNIYL